MLVTTVVLLVALIEDSASKDDDRGDDKYEAHLEDGDVGVDVGVGEGEDEGDGVGYAEAAVRSWFAGDISRSYAPPWRVELVRCDCGMYDGL